MENSVSVRLKGVQVLRGLAAFLVVIHHCFSMGPFQQSAFPPIGALGVAIFFVISGFVVTKNLIEIENPFQFLRDRVVRIFPLYWIFTTIFLLTVALDFTSISINTVELPHILKSYFFIPFSAPFYDDKIWPLLIPGWTLNFEIFFYLFLGLCYLFNPKLFIVLIIPAFSVFFLLGNLFFYEIEYFRFYASWYLFDFLSGIFLYQIMLKKRYINCVSFVFCIFIWTLVLGPSSSDFLIKSMFSGIAICLVFLSIKFEVRLRRVPNKLILVGDSSYSLYLSHVFVIGLFNLILNKIGGDHSVLIEIFWYFVMIPFFCLIGGIVK